LKNFKDLHNLNISFNDVYVTYDTYSGSNIITEGSTSVSFAKIVKTCSNNNVRYALLENEDTKKIWE